MTERICLHCGQPKEILVSICNECKEKMTEKELNRFRWKETVSTQTRDLIEAQDMLIKKHEEVILDLRSKLQQIEEERTSFCDMYIAEREVNKELREFNCLLENKLTSLGG